MLSSRPSLVKSLSTSVPILLHGSMAKCFRLTPLVSVDLRPCRRLVSKLTHVDPRWPYTGRKYTTSYSMNGPHMDEEIMGGPGPMPGMQAPFPPYYRYVSLTSSLALCDEFLPLCCSRICLLLPE